MCVLISILFGSFAALRDIPVEVFFVRFDRTGLAVNAVLSVDDELLLAGLVLDELIDLGRTVPFCL